MGRMYTALILRYDSKKGMCGCLLGLITFTDGKSLKVWNADFHEECKRLAKYPTSYVRYQFAHSGKWGDSLSMIASAKTDHELYDDARAQDEAQMIGHSEPGQYMRDRLSRAIQKQVSDDHDELMGRVG